MSAKDSIPWLRAACLGLWMGLMSLLYGQQGPLQIEVLVPISTPDGQREISLERYARFQVLLTNVSDQSIRLWKDWNTWGYFNLQLDWRSGERVFPIRRKPPKQWNGDFPDFWTLLPGEKVVLEIDMRSGEWEGIPDLYGEMIEAELFATYQNKPDPLAEEFGVWVGKVRSAEIPVIFK
ncbi:MAG: hypothetical protein AAF399_28820 [Bacteroidota bacterium]